MRVQILVAAVLLTTCGCQHPVVYQDISPDSANGHGSYQESTAGVTYALAGDEQTLFAVSLNAGVFRAVSGGAWQQLENSPRYATSIAVDPTNRRHVVVGERNGDAALFQLNRTGVWESFDNGDTWTLAFSPLTQTACRATQSQAVPAIFFTPVGTLLIGTPCGVGRRPTGSNQFDFSASPSNVSRVKAFAASQGPNGTIIWAGAGPPGSGFKDALLNLFLNQLLISDGTDGSSWKTVPIPSNIEGWGIGWQPGADFTVAAFGQTAILNFIPNSSTNPGLWTKNFCTLLYYFNDRNFRGTSGPVWHVQSLKDICGNGTGNGGRVSFFSVPSYGPPGLISPFQVLFNGADDILAGIGILPDGTLLWLPLGEAQCGGGCSTSDNIHGDVWAVHRASDSGVVRVGTDGGVFASEPKYGWVQQNEGLHTHHAHALAVLPSGQPKGHYPRLAYVATDNSDWWRDSKPLPGVLTVGPAGWNSYGTLGDGSWLAGDAANPSAALLVRQANLAIATDFGAGMPSGAGIGPNQSFVISCGIKANDSTQCADNPSVSGVTFGPTTFQIIQTLPGEPVPPLLDAVMLTNPILSVLNNGTVRPFLLWPGGPPLLIRNQAFLADPDINHSQYQGWQLVSGNVPLGAFAVWVSNGHKNPVFYVAAPGLKGIQIWKLPNVGGSWIHLTQLDGRMLPPQTIGPIYVDPYDPDHLFVLGTAGILVSAPPSGGHVDASTPFPVDSVLTQLLTNSGQYALAGAYAGGNGQDVVLATKGSTKPILSAVAFQRGDSHRVIAASPVTGIFAALDDKRQWLSLSEYLPKPFTMVSDVGIQDASFAYAVQEGRSILRLFNWDQAKLGCYFSSSSVGKAQLMSADGLPVASVQVSVLTVQNGAEMSSTQTTDSQGYIPVQGPSQAVLHLSFGGNDNIASCETALLLP